MYCTFGIFLSYVVLSALKKYFYSLFAYFDQDDKKIYFFTTRWQQNTATSLVQLLSFSLSSPQGKVKARRLRTMLSNLNTSALGPCSSPQFRSPTGRVGSLEPRTLSSLEHGHNAGVVALGKVVFSLASEGRMAL